MPNKRIDRSIKSIIALRNFLRDVCEKPGAHKADELLREALKSQGGLAKYTNAELGIASTSINTLKRVSAEVIDGGFRALDDLRVGALERIEDLEQREKTSNKRTRSGLAKRVDELEADTLILEQTNYFLVQALTEAISDLKSVANVDDKTARDRRSQEATRKLLSMMTNKPLASGRRPAESNVIHLNREDSRD